MTQHPELLQDLASRPLGRSAIQRLVETSKLRTMIKRCADPETSAPSSEYVFGVGVATAAVADSLFYTLQESPLPLSPIESAITTTVLAVFAGGAAATAYGAKLRHALTSSERLRVQLAHKEAEAIEALDEAGINESFLRNGGLEFYLEAVESDPSFIKSLIATKADHNITISPL